MKILFPYEFGPLAERAENEVEFLAEKLNAEIHILHVIPKGKGLTRAGRLKSEKQDLEEALGKLKEVAERMRRNNELNVRIRVEAGKVEDAVIDAAEKLEADLIIFGTKGGESILNTFLSSPVNYVIQHAPCPCLTIRERPRREEIDDILVVQNPDQPYNLHYQWAIKMAKALGTWIRILVIYDPKLTDAEDARTYSHHLARHTKSLGITVSDKTHRPFNDKVPEMILNYADDTGADLIAMAEHDWPDLGDDSITRTNTWLGYVVNHSKIPVLSTRPDQEE